MPSFHPTNATYFSSSSSGGEFPSYESPSSTSEYPTVTGEPFLAFNNGSGGTEEGSIGPTVTPAPSILYTQENNVPADRAINVPDNGGNGGVCVRPIKHVVVGGVLFWLLGGLLLSILALW